MNTIYSTTKTIYNGRSFVCLSFCFLNYYKPNCLSTSVNIMFLNTGMLSHLELLQR
jgi:hypothetical protein